MKWNEKQHEKRKKKDTEKQKVEQFVWTLITYVVYKFWFLYKKLFLARFFLFLLKLMSVIEFLLWISKFTLPTSIYFHNFSLKLLKLMQVIYSQATFIRKSFVSNEINATTSLNFITEINESYWIFVAIVEFYITC